MTASALSISYVLTLPVTVAYEQHDLMLTQLRSEALGAPLLTATEPVTHTADESPEPAAEAVEEVAEVAPEPNPAVADEQVEEVAEPPEKETEDTETRTVPFYSQFADISDPNWKKVSCGIASLAMLVDYYEPAVAPDTLLQKGIAAGAYISSAGWSHAGLINLSKNYGLTGESVSLAEYSMDAAFEKFSEVVDEGPVMASVHYTFEPTNPIPHLVVITDVADGRVYYNDPAEPTGGGSISIQKFQNSWKKRYIAIRPTT